MKLLRLLLFIPMIAAIFAGCIKEDRDHCLEDFNVRLILQFEGKDREAVKHTDILLFDSEERFLQRYHVLESELGVNGEYDLVLAPGEYNVVAWANVDSNSSYGNFSEGQTLFCDCTLEIPDQSTMTGDAIYYAPKKDKPGSRSKGKVTPNDMNIYSFIVPEKGSVTKIMPFIRAHRTINVFIKGLEDPLGINVEAHNLWKSYDFYFNNLDRRCTLRQQASPGNKNGVHYQEASFHSGLGFIEPDMDIQVVPISGPACQTTINLDQFIKDNNLTDIDVIDIMVEFDDFGVAISVPTWSVKPIEPGN